MASAEGAKRYRPARIDTDCAAGATIRAFRRCTEREEEAANIAMRALEEWQGNIARLAELQARGAAAGAETEATLDARLSAIERKLPITNRTPNDFAE